MAHWHDSYFLLLDLLIKFSSCQCISELSDPIRMKLLINYSWVSFTKRDNTQPISSDKVTANQYPKYSWAQTFHVVIDWHAHKLCQDLEVILYNAYISIIYLNVARGYMAYLTIEGAIYSHFNTKIEISSIKLGQGVIHSFTWIYSMEIQIPESKFTLLTMINVIFFKIFTTFHCKCYFLRDRVWSSKCNISK